MVTLNFRLPSSALLVNLLGLFGLLGLAAAVGGLTQNWWWSLLVLSGEAVFIHLVAVRNAEPADVGELRRVA